MLEALTATLVLITGYYAWQNQRMVGEMRKTRELSLLPKLGLEFLRVGPTTVVLDVRSVGPGPALSIEARLVFTPAVDKAPADERRWRQHVLAPNEAKQFMVPVPGSDMNTLASTYRRIELTGTMKDATGRSHRINEAIEDLAEWRKILGEAKQRWVAEPEKRVAAAVHGKLEGPLSALVDGLEETAAAVRSLGQPSPGENEAPVR